MEMSLAPAAIVTRGAGMAGMAGAFVPHIHAIGANVEVNLSRMAGRDMHGPNFSRPVRMSSNTFSCLLRFESHNPTMAAPRTSRFKSDIRIKPEKKRVQEPETRLCEAPGCIGPGNCRVSKSPKNLSEYFWYCAAHARVHNEAWDFFKDMGDDDIQRFREEALTGHRPTWPLGKRGAKARMGQTPLGGVE